MEEIKDDILVRATQMISLCRHADTTANQTLIRLADQHEQLEDIQTHLSSIDTTLIDSKRNLNRLKGISQRMINTFRTNFHRIKILPKLVAHSTNKRKSCPAVSIPSQRMQSSPQPTECKIFASDTFIDGQIDEAFYEISHLVRSLKDKAYSMNDQLVGQSEILDCINERTKDATEHVQEQNSDLRKIVHN